MVQGEVAIVTVQAVLSITAAGVDTAKVAVGTAGLILLSLLLLWLPRLMAAQCPISPLVK